MGQSRKPAQGEQSYPSLVAPYSVERHLFALRVRHGEAPVHGSHGRDSGRRNPVYTQDLPSCCAEPPVAATAMQAATLPAQAPMAFLPHFSAQLETPNTRLWPWCSLFLDHSACRFLLSSTSPLPFTAGLFILSCLRWGLC